MQDTGWFNNEANFCCNINQYPDIWCDHDGDDDGDDCEDGDDGGDDDGDDADKEEDSDDDDATLRIQTYDPLMIRWMIRLWWRWYVWFGKKYGTDDDCDMMMMRTDTCLRR